MKEIKLIPAVAQVLVEYERLYGRKKALEMFDFLCGEIEKHIESLLKEKK